jgi:AcrR family transcriptional regulator
MKYERTPGPEPDAASTRHALLRTGARLFAERGFEGASVRAITAEAGANLGAITYHFGSKESFYDAVVDSVVSPFAERVMSAARTDGPPLDRLEQIVRAYFGHLMEHPEIPRLVMQSVMATGLPPGLASERLKGLLVMLAGIVSEGQADGSIRAGDPRLLGLGVVSQSLHLAVMRDALTSIAGIDLTEPSIRQSLAQHLVRFVRGGLAAGGHESEA